MGGQGGRLELRSEGDPVNKREAKWQKGPSGKAEVDNDGGGKKLMCVYYFLYVGIVNVQFT
jgi:hypothetical protein